MNSTAPKTLPRVQAVMASSTSATIAPPIRWLFYVFIFSIPFETVYIEGFASAAFTMTKWMGIFFALTALLQPQVCYAWPPRAFWFFTAYMLAYLFHGLLGDSRYVDLAVSRSVSLAQFLILFWVSCNMMKDKRGMTGALIAIVASVSSLAILVTLGLANFSVDSGIQERASALGEDPNYIGALYAVAALIVLNLAFGRKTTSHWGIVMWGFCAGLGLLMVRTGSRGAFVAVLCGAAVIVLRKRARLGIVLNLIIAAMALALLVFLASRTEIMRSRWEEFFEKGKTAHREELFAKTSQMFIEKPWFGWGPGVHTAELATRMASSGDIFDTHNDLMWAATATGLLGLIPLVIGVLLCVRSAWKARKGIWGTLPLALLVAILVLSLSVTVHKRKIVWLLFSCAIASSAATYVSPVPVSNSRNTR